MERGCLACWIFTTYVLGVSPFLHAGCEAGCETECKEELAQSVHTPAGLVWVFIPQGTFRMGSEKWADEQPMHDVRIPAFEMTRSEITVAQYRECVDAAVCCEPDSGGPYENWNDPGFDNHPVNALDWYQAREFCRWIGGDLPSESMWEYAAGSGEKAQLYPWGDDAPDCETAIMDDGVLGEGCGTGRTAPVCSRPLGNTAQGLCDMAGNVWEWVLDWYHGSYDCTLNRTAYNCASGDTAPSDGSPWDEAGTLIVERGGSFNADAFYLRASARLRVYPIQRSFGLGFRCARFARITADSLVVADDI